MYTYIYIHIEKWQKSCARSKRNKFPYFLIFLFFLYFTLLYAFFSYLYAAIASSSATSFFFHFSLRSSLVFFVFILFSLFSFFVYIFSSRFSFLLTRAIKNRSPATHTRASKRASSTPRTSRSPPVPPPLFPLPRVSLYFISLFFFPAPSLCWLFFLHISGNILESECTMAMAMATAPPPTQPQLKPHQPPFPAGNHPYRTQKSIHVRKKERKRNPKVKMK